MCVSVRSGGFLIPYVIMLLLEGIPLFYLELAIGQKMRLGSIGAWTSISPYLGGVGKPSHSPLTEWGILTACGIIPFCRENLYVQQQKIQRTLCLSVVQRQKLQTVVVIKQHLPLKQHLLAISCPTLSRFEHFGTIKERSKYLWLLFVSFKVLPVW